MNQLTEAHLEALREIVGAEHVATSRTDLLSHSFDATQRQFMPNVVVHPHTTEEVAAIVQLAACHCLPILPRGAGSGFTGGALPVRGGIVLVLTRMNRILEIDSDNLIAVVEPGVVTARLQEAVERVGLFYPPDPASKEFSTLGGNVAECAGGPRCVKYGVTRDYVLGLTVVTPDGAIIHTGGRTIKNVVGYDLTRLFVGSEGTLGIVTKIILRLLPKPASKRTMLATFADIDGAAEAVSTIIRGKIIPTTLEFMDASAIKCVRGLPGIDLPENCQALLIIEVDGEAAQLTPQLNRIVELIQPLGLLQASIARDADEAEALWRVRRSVSPSLRKLGPNKFNEDIVVPRARVPEMIRALDDISSRLDLPIINFGHAGDGNIHVNVMVDLREPGMEARVQEALADIFRTTIALGGSVSGEHGIGLAKQPYIAFELDSPTLAVMRSIKAALDPQGIMNPGKIFPEKVDTTHPATESVSL
ncbi:MAG: FAD-binding protein [Desulfobulbaceae bacterium]|nr:FAD-binding protein [Desulfobulbaceae bacterium]